MTVTPSTTRRSPSNLGSERTCGKWKSKRRMGEGKEGPLIRPCIQTQHSHLRPSKLIIQEQIAESPLLSHQTLKKKKNNQKK